MINININDRGYKVSENTTVLQVRNELGINIPTLCYDERLEPEASCNLCIVEVEGQKDLLTSCTLKVTDEMKIQTHNDRVIGARKEILAKLLSNHPQDWPDHFKTDTCRLHSYYNEYEISISDSVSKIDKNRYPIDRSNPFYFINPNKCILCGLCIRVCSELQGRGTLEINDKGYISRKPAGDVECESCGNCLSVCPTGAIREMGYDEEFAQMQEYDATEKKAEEQEARKVKTTCPYCGVGCQLELQIKGQNVVEVKPVNVLPNNGLLCVKGKFGYGFINHSDRLKNPLIKKNGEFVEATWEEAYSLIADKAKEIKGKYGSSVFGGLSSARCTNEENYLFQKMMRGAFGANNVDQCARL